MQTRSYYSQTIAMNKLLIIFLLCAGLGAQAQTTKEYNDPNAKARVLKAEFSSISVSSGIQLFLTQSDQIALAVSVSNERLEEGFKTEVVNGVLKIYYEPKGIPAINFKNRKLIAYLSVKNIQSIRASGGAIIRLVNPFKSDALSLDCTSGSLLTGTVALASLQASATSGAQVTLAGTADNVDISVTSGAIFKGGSLQAQTCTAQANSGAAVKIAVEKEMTAFAKSGASVSYAGNATLKKSSVNSGAVVKKIK